MFDASNNSAFASVLVARFPTHPANYLEAGIITDTDEHAAQPTHFKVSLLGVKSVLPRRTMIKRELVEAFSKKMDNKTKKADPHQLVGGAL